MKAIVFLLLLSLIAPLSLPAQIRGGCTPNSVTIALAQRMNVAGMWEWNCYAQNIGTTPATLSVVGFALDFIELEQVNQGDVIDIFTQKQQQSGWAKAAKIAGLVAAGGMIVLGQGYVTIPARGLADIGLLAYGASESKPLFVSQEPSISNAIAGMLTGDQILAPGAGFQWKVYASNTGAPIGHNQLAVAKRSGRSVKPQLPSLGPKILSQGHLIDQKNPFTPQEREGPIPGAFTHPAVNDVEVAGWELPLPNIEYWAFAK